MKNGRINLVARQFFLQAIRSRMTILLWILFSVLSVYAAVSAWQQYVTHDEVMDSFQQQARKSWEENPDKHPHRMAHFGTYAFRPKAAMSILDPGLDYYTGNAVFLEAHKQNPVNFSEAGMSGGMVRFGSLSVSVLLQVVLPLILLFLGFGSIAADKETGNLRLLVSQGATMPALIFGKAIGLFILALLFMTPGLLCGSMALFFAPAGADAGQGIWRFGWYALSYLLFAWIGAVSIVLISAFSKTAKESLLKGLGCWLVLAILLPRVLQTIGELRFPVPSRTAMETAVEEELIKEGDSHNPDDPHFKAIRDSVLKANNTDSVEKLSFNYGGLLSMIGEEKSTVIYNRHLEKLYKQFKRQNQVSQLAGLVNPFNAIRDLSMISASTDMETYLSFQRQAEAYRYKLAQTMNSLQKQFIPNRKPGPNDPPYTISKSHWKELEDFRYQPLPVNRSLSGAWMAAAGLGVWLVLTVFLAGIYSRKASVI